MHYYTVVYLLLIDWIGISLMYMGYRMKMNRIPYRHGLALRTKYALQSEATWYDVHRTMAQPTMKLGALLCLLTVSAPLLEASSAVGTLFFVFVNAFMIPASLAWYWREYSRTRKSPLGSSTMRETGRFANSISPGIREDPK